MTQARETAARYCSLCRTPYGRDDRFCPVDGAPIVDADAADDPRAGMTIGGRYLLRRRIGRGGMGEVYEADHIGLDKRVAVKFLLDKYTSDRDVLTRFHREARTASKIGHDNIVDVFDIGETDDGASYIVMELLEGEDLGALLRRAGRLSVPHAVHVIRQVCEGLAAAHDEGVVHRDMKPENVFLAKRRGRPPVVKIMDFGISKIIDFHDSRVRLTETGAVVGTPIYMAPEQAAAAADVDHRADIYAVGIMLYELLCGQPPFVSQSYLQLVTQHVTERPTPPRRHRPDIPAGIEKLILRALEKDPGRRVPTARAFAEALPPVSAEEAEAALTPATRLAGVALTGAPTVARGARRGRGGWIVAAGVAVIAAGAGGGWWLTRDAPGAAVSTVADAAPPAPPPVITKALPAGASLEVDSKPRGATVLVNGERKGETPLELRDVEPGVHRLQLELAGYEVLETDKEVRDGYAETFFGALRPVKRGTKRRARAVKPEPEKPAVKEEQKDEPVKLRDRKANPFVDGK